MITTTALMMMGYCYKYVIHLTYVHASVHSSLKPSCIQCFCNVSFRIFRFGQLQKKIGREISSVLVYLACWKSMMWCNKWSSQVNLEKQYTRHTSTVSSSPELLILMIIIMMTTTTTEPNHHLPLWLLPLPYKQKDATATVRVCRAFVYTTRRDQWRFFTWVHSPVELVPLKKPKRENMVERKSATKKRQEMWYWWAEKNQNCLASAHFCHVILHYLHISMSVSSWAAVSKERKISVFTFHYFIFMLLLLLTIQMMIISVCVMWYIKIQEVTR